MKKIEKLMDSLGIERVLARVAHQILEKNSNLDNLALVGMQTRGVHLSKSLKTIIDKIEKNNVSTGVLDTTLYRDDYRTSLKQPSVKPTDISFDVNGKDIILVDDVLYTGRTVRAALDALMDLGRPRSIQLMVLVDRGHRELPIRADFIGKKLTTTQNQLLSLSVKELDGEDALWLVEKEE
jgi:pyrimidine operon attenuation protein/uracil phosphoribosyltransferase